MQKHVGLAFLGLVAAVNLPTAAIADQNSSRGFIGVQVSPMTADMADATGRPRGLGEFVQGAMPGGGADKAGIRAGDIIISANGKAVDEKNNLTSLISSVHPGDRVAITFIRNSQERTVEVEVSVRPPENQLTASVPKIDYYEMRIAAERYISTMLIDPSSAQFEWPWGFVDGYWKPLIGKRYVGYVTCGYVNAKNRRGGYIGRTAFAVVISNGVVIYADLNTSRSIDYIGNGCARSNFPPAQVQMFNAPASPQSSAQNQSQSTLSSVADEIEKLAKLKEKGLINQKEFEDQKNKLLGM